MSAQIVTLDFETFYDKDYSLSKMTTEAYVRDERFELIGVSYSINGSGEEWFSSSQDRIAEWLGDSIDWSKAFLLCQNTLFDGLIMVDRLGIKPMAYMDTMLMSRALYPHEKSHSLKAIAQRLGLDEEKGSEVHNNIGMRRKDFGAARLREYGAYCKKDTRLTWKAAKIMLPQIPKKELKLMDSTIRMGVEPVLVAHTQKLLAYEEALLNKQFETLDTVRLSTGAESIEDLKYTLASNDKFASMLRKYGVEPPMKISKTTGKEAYAFAKTDQEFTDLLEHPDVQVQAIVAARMGVKSTIETTRCRRFIETSERGPMPIPLRYAGAWTFRWSADSSGAVNWQNVPRNSPMKEAIEAPEGYMMCGADLSNIELRLGMWLAGEMDKVDLIRNKRDLYKEMASVAFGVDYDNVSKDQRQTAKVMCLSLIYGTGPARLKETLRIMAKLIVHDDEAKRLTLVYRQNHPNLVNTWKQAEFALASIVAGDSPSLFNGLVTWDKEKQGFLLPSGLHLQMPNLRAQMGEGRKPEYVFDSKGMVERTYGPKLFQGLTQALARCVMAEGWLRLQKKYPVVISIHDALYWIAKEDEAQESLNFGVECMTAPVSWCETLPLDAEGGFGKTLAEV